MLDTIKFNKDVMRKSANNGFTNATDAADYLVKKEYHSGMPMVSWEGSCFIVLKRELPLMI